MARLLVVLAAASGCLDVFCLTRLGGFFASVITGNLVQFGHAVATAETRLLAGQRRWAATRWAWLAARCTCAASGQAGAAVPQVLAAAEAALLVGGTAGCLGTAARPGPAGGLALLATRM